MAKLDLFPNSEPFIHLRQKQLETCRNMGGVSLLEKIECFLAGMTKKCLQSVTVSADSLKSLQMSLQESQYEVEHALQQGILLLLLLLLLLLSYIITHLVRLCVTVILPVNMLSSNYRTIDNNDIYVTRLHTIYVIHHHMRIGSMPEWAWPMTSSKNRPASCAACSLEAKPDWGWMWVPPPTMPRVWRQINPHPNNRINPIFSVCVFPSMAEQNSFFMA